MKRTPTIVQSMACLAITSLALFVSCKKQAQLPPAAAQEATAEPRLKPMTAGDTLLKVNYETGTLTSGITGVTATGAPAADAAYMVSPGATGSYGIAHKVVFGDSNYLSAGAYRSESDADGVSAARFSNGNARRYEFSVLLKDWPVWNSSQAVSQPVLFQTKITGAAYVPCQVMAKRNAFVVRLADSTYTTLISDFTSYINQWVKFRIDVLWSTTTSGYINIYAQVPGTTSYSLKLSKTSFKTYTGTGTDHGYIKWGVYDGPASGTRIACHDNINIIEL